jgi:hypothetical protein
MLVNRDLSSLADYFDGVQIKLARIVEYWERFKLTLPGRITVCKTFMISQIGYLGSVITPTEVQTRNMQAILDNFCLGSMNTAKKKRYIPATEGGLGLINVKDYIISLQCAWVKRVTQHWGDMWRFDLKKMCYGNPLIADSSTFDPVRNPVLHNICSSFGKFRDAFVRKDANYKKALLLKKSIFQAWQRGQWNPL